MQTFKNVSVYCKCDVVVTVFIAGNLSEVFLYSRFKYENPEAVGGVLGYVYHCVYIYTLCGD